MTLLYLFVINCLLLLGFFLNKSLAVGLVFTVLPQATQASGIDSSESIAGLLKLLQIRLRSGFYTEDSILQHESIRPMDYYFNVLLSSGILQKSAKNQDFWRKVCDFLHWEGF